MNARAIQREIMRDRWQSSICCPNYTPPRWWECDVFELTKSGYFREYEVKLSRSDFRADAKKTLTRWNGQRGNLSGMETRNKHTELTARSPVAPVQFWFVAPPDVIPEHELPEWAGLIIAEPNEARGVWLTESRRAPRLHRQKIDEKLRHDLFTTFYFRFQRLFQRYENETEKDQSNLDDHEGRDQTASENSQSDQSEGAQNLAQAVAQD